MTTPLAQVIADISGLPLSEAERQVANSGGLLVVLQPTHTIHQNFIPGRVRVYVEDGVVNRVYSYDDLDGPASLQT